MTDLERLEKIWAYGAHPLGSHFPRIGWAVFRVLWALHLISRPGA